jgi:archaellum component FlaC
LKGVSESVEAKTDAFTAEQETVSSVVDAEINSLNQLKESLKSVSESVEAIGKSFEGFGKDSPFSSIFGDIKDNADTIKNFSDILKTSKEARD